MVSDGAGHVRVDLRPREHPRRAVNAGASPPCRASRGRGERYCLLDAETALRGADRRPRCRRRRRHSRRRASPRRARGRPRRPVVPERRDDPPERTLPDRRRRAPRAPGDGALPRRARPPGGPAGGRPARLQVVRHRNDGAPDRALPGAGRVHRLAPERDQRGPDRLTRRPGKDGRLRRPLQRRHARSCACREALSVRLAFVHHRRARRARERAVRARHRAPRLRRACRVYDRHLRGAVGEARVQLHDECVDRVDRPDHARALGGRDRAGNARPHRRGSRPGRPRAGP